MIIEKAKKIFAVGMEIGKPAESSAVAVVELADSQGSPTDPLSAQSSSHVTHIECLPPGTPYKEIAQSLTDLFDAIETKVKKEFAKYGRSVDVTFNSVIDRTVVSSQVTDMILTKMNRPARKVVISGSRTESYSGGIYYVPEQELIGLLRAQLEMSHLKFAQELPETPCLVDELVAYQERKTPNAPPMADVGREYPSEDLVFAVALACWALRQTGFEYEFVG